MGGDTPLPHPGDESGMSPVATDPCLPPGDKRRSGGFLGAGGHFSIELYAEECPAERIRIASSGMAASGRRFAGAEITQQAEGVGAQ